MFWANLAVLIKTMISGMMEELRRVRVERHNFSTLKYLGYDMVVLVMSFWEELARLITTLLMIDWVFFDMRPARLNEQIKPYLE